MDIRDAFRGALALILGLILATAAAAQDSDLDVEQERSLNASIEVTQTFDDNLLDSDDEQEEGFVTYIRPQYDLFYPFRFAAFEMSAALPIFYHWNDDEASEVLYDVSGALSTARGRGFALTVRDRLTPVAISYGRTDYEESNKNKVQANFFTATPSYQFNVTSRSTMMIRYVFGMTHYFDDDLGENYFEHTASLTSATYLTARIELIVQYAFLVRDLMEMDVERYTHQGRIGLEFTWTRVVFGVYGGISYMTFNGDDLREDEDEDRIGEYVAASISWQATEWLTISLSYTRVLTDDVFTNTYFAQNANLDLAFPVTSWLAFQFGAFVRDYRAETQLQQSDLIFGGSVDVIFTVVERLDIFAGYKYEQNVGDEDRNDFVNHMGLVGLKYTF